MANIVWASIISPYYYTFILYYIRYTFVFWQFADAISIKYRFNNFTVKWLCYVWQRKIPQTTFCNQPFDAILSFFPLFNLLFGWSWIQSTLALPFCISFFCNQLSSETASVHQTIEWLKLADLAVTIYLRPYLSNTNFSLVCSTLQ